MTGHISAPVSLEWFPPSFQHILKRIDLGKIMIDLVFLSTALVGPRSFGMDRMEMMDENTCAKGM